jgi:hypothetical protein
MDTKDRINETITSVRENRQSANTRHTTLLVLGDIIVFLVFAAIGRRSHSEAGNVLGIAITALPFAAAWFIVSPFVGAFKRGIEDTPGKMSLRTFLGWLAAWPLAMLLRGIFVDQGIPPWTFALITLVTNTILLQAWRVPFSFFFKRRKV